MHRFDLAAYRSAQRLGCNFFVVGRGFYAFGKTHDEAQRKHDRLIRTK